MMESGKPCRWKIFKMKRLVSSLASTVVEQGTRYLILVNPLMTTQIVSWPSEIDWQGVQNAIRCVLRYLHLLTNMVVSYELFDILLQHRPEVASSNKVKGFWSPGVSSSGDVMVVLDDP
jgi:hypothetical protein